MALTVAVMNMCLLFFDIGESFLALVFETNMFLLCVICLRFRTDFDITQTDSVTSLYIIDWCHFEVSGETCRIILSADNY